MRGFFTQKNKFKNIDDSVIKLSNQTNRRYGLNDDISKKIEANAVLHTLDKLRNFSTNWESLDKPDEGLGFDNRRYKNWTIEFPRFDYRLLPFLDIKVLYRRNEGSVIDTVTITPTISKTFRIFDIVGQTYLKQAFLNVSLSFTNTNPTERVYQTKLLISFINPRDAF